MRTIFISMAVLGLLAYCTCPVIAQNQESKERQVLTFERLQANPKAFKAAEVTFRGQFHKLSGVFSPFFTLYTPSGFLNFASWEYEAPLWKKEVFKSDFPFLYVAKGDRALCDKISNMKADTCQHRLQKTTLGGDTRCKKRIPCPYNLAFVRRHLWISSSRNAALSPLPSLQLFSLESVLPWWSPPP